MCGTESTEVAHDIHLFLGTILTFLNDVEQAKAIFAQEKDSLSVNMPACEGDLFNVYHNRAIKTHAAHNLDRGVVNLKLAFPRFLSSSLFYRVIDIMDSADKAARQADNLKEFLQEVKAT